jgi:hypothetical protein
MSIDVKRLVTVEVRHPHKEMLDALLDRVEFDGDVPMNHLTPRSCLVGDVDERLAELKRFSVERIANAIDELADADIIRERSDPHTGHETIGIRELVSLLDEPYQGLEEEIYEKARATGLRPKWRHGQGWRLVNGGGETVCEGPMHALSTFLDEQLESSSGG